MNIKDLAFWLMIIIVISLSIYLLVFIKGESYKCMNNPLVYGVSKYRTDAGEFTCSCSSQGVEGYIFVTKDNLTYESSYNSFYTLQEKEPERRIDLKQLLEKEIDIEIEDGDCFSYAQYYNKTISAKYPELDVRWIRYVDICNNHLFCNNSHTFLVIGGYGSECILDQHQIVCIDVV